MAATHGRDEVGQIVPEPGQLASQCRYARVGRGRLIRRRRAGQQPFLVQQTPVRFAQQLADLLLRDEAEFHFRAVGQNEKEHVRQVELLREQRLAQLPGERPRVGGEVVVGVVGCHQNQVDVGVGVGRAASVGADQQGRGDARVVPAGDDKAINDPLYVRRQQFLSVHLALIL